MLVHDLHFTAAKAKVVCRPDVIVVPELDQHTSRSAAESIRGKLARNSEKSS